MFTSKRKAVTIIALLFMVALVLGLSGCGNKGAGSGNKEATAPEKYPSKPIKVILTHGAGGSVDTQARLIAPYIEKYLGGQLVLENMEGAGGRKARGFVFKEKPDGYTLMVTGMPSTIVGELLYKGEYKTLDFTYIANFMGKDYSLVAVADKSPIKSYKELVEASKKKPLKLGTAGTGTTDHLGAVMLKQYTGLQFDIVPFDSTADQMMALLGGKLDAIMDAVSSSGVRSDLRPLVLMGPQRSEMLPDVPTLQEEGFSGLDVSYSLGFLAPSGLPEDIRKILEDAIDKASRDPEYLAKLKEAKTLPLQLKGAGYQQMIQDLYSKTKEVIPLMEADLKK
ncbi:hypothetical protein SY88_16590 [Clostridiales bacterium PH28_bin88]|nr:hypothetical protein SY88_16590 [Clostridiales bacterium PH28_bin88]